MQLFKRHASALYPMLLLQFSLYLSTAVNAQDTSSLAAMKVSLSVRNTTLLNIFDNISSQTGLHFFYSREYLDDREKYSIRAADEPVLAVVNRLVNKKGFACKVEGRLLVVYKSSSTTSAQTQEQSSATDIKTYRLHGQVLDTTGTPLPGATILIKGTNNRYSAKEDGQFFLSTTTPNPTLRISYTGYDTEEYSVTDPEKDISVALRQHTSPLDETVVIAYGTTSKRLNTGNVAKVAASDIEKYPVSNPLLTLQGRVPGLTIYQLSGAPGTPLEIRLRVQNSFLSSNTPLIVLDGIPLPAGSQNINLLTSHPNSSVGLFSIFNNMDIASIEVLKDADATAIYGSRGGNGVIVITTKRGTTGNLKVRADYTMGVSQASSKLSLLNTPQYLKLRREAFRNDGLTITNIPGDPGNAPDILAWDTTRYTDWQKWQIGGNAPTSNANMFLSGGNETTQMMMSLGFYREGTVYPSDMAYLRGTASFSFNHRSADNRFRLSVYTNYAKDRNDMFNSPLFSILLSPNAPKLYDENNQLNWIEGNEPFKNPAAEYLKTYAHEKENQIVNLNVEYSILRDLKIKFNLGYNSTTANENLRIPKASQNPYLTNNITGTSSFGNNSFKSYLAEPQAEYYRRIKDGELIILAGASFQYTSNYTSTIVGQGYTNDALLGSLDGAGVIGSSLTNRLEYKYGATFGRITYKLRNRYIVNLSGRRDGSSKFSPEHRFSNFGSVGAAWIFSEEPFIKEELPFFSFGKLRSSFGVTGNDQIADYKFLDTWSPSLGNPYQNTTTMQPDALYNPAYNWERTKKIEAALELGFFKDRLIATLAYFRNRSDNQLIKYSLPWQTGFSSILKNFDALVQSSGWEFTINSDLIKSKSLTLNAAFNISIPRNKLLRFRNLASSSYAGTYVIGESLNVLYKLQSGGVSPDSGYFRLADADGNGHYTNADYKVIGSLDPTYHGGFQLNLQYKRLGFSLAGEFRKQLIPNYLFRTYLNNFFPGTMVNQSDFVLDHWQQKGDIARYPKYSTKPTGTVYAPRNEIMASNQAYSDGSFLKCRNIAVSYTLDMRKRKDKAPTQLTIFCNAQNLFTITGYKEGDPETADIFCLPLLRTIAGGIRFSIQ